MAEEKYDQDYFIALALKRKDAWNEWWRNPANEKVPVTFAGTDFSEDLKDTIDFSGFEFGDAADFSRCKWRGVRWEEIQKDFTTFAPGRACFTGAAFGSLANFSGAAFGNLAMFAHAAFGGRASFAGAAFGDAANFDKVTFSAWANFTGATFSPGASFDGAAFGDYAFFGDTTFGDMANFEGATFGDMANFGGATFGDWASFAGTIFKGRVDFKGKTEDQSSKDLVANVRTANEEDRAALKKRHEDSWTGSGSAPDRFLTISFANVRFGKAVFSGRAFVEAADFTQARFYYPPDFDAAAKDARIDFTGAHIGFVPPGRLHWASETEVPVRLRALRKFAEETKNHDLERDLYIEERKAERGVYLVQPLVDVTNELEKLGKKLRYISKDQTGALSKWWHKAAALISHAPRITLITVATIARLVARLPWIVVMGLYWALADYGRSFVRPALWLIASRYFFYWCYLAILAPLISKANPALVDKYKAAVRILAFGSALSFLGPPTNNDAEMNKFLLCPDGDCLPIPPVGYHYLVLGQKYPFDHPRVFHRPRLAQLF